MGSRHPRTHAGKRTPLAGSARKLNTKSAAPAGYFGATLLVASRRLNTGNNLLFSSSPVWYPLF